MSYQFPLLTWVDLYSLGPGEDPAFDTLYTRFKEGTDEFRNQRFKFIAKVVEL